MSRRLTKSPPIQFRVPIELWPYLQQRAARNKQTVAEYVQGAVEPALRSDHDKATGK